jgi:hypothetical protein
MPCIKPKCTETTTKGEWSNQMECPAGHISCYVCRRFVKKCDFGSHFCGHTFAGGVRCAMCRICPAYNGTLKREDAEAMRAAAAAAPVAAAATAAPEVAPVATNPAAATAAAVTAAAAPAPAETAAAATAEKKKKKK